MSSSPAAVGDASTAPRASGRVRKQLEMYTTSPAFGSKRKRDGAQDVDVDHEMPEDYVSDEEEASEEEEPDEEELKEKRARARKAKAPSAKQRATKKPKTNGATILPIRAAATGKKRAPKKVKQLATMDAEEAGGLFADVFAHGEDLQKIATDWRNRFNEHESNSLAEVINFVLSAAGCTGKVTEHDIEDPDAVTGKIMDLQEEYQASNPTEYPLMAKGKSATTIKQGVTGFLDVLVRSVAKDGLLYDNPELIENIQVWFSTMSSAANRPMRHTATVVSLGIVTSLCIVAHDLTEKAAKDRRQAESERKKGAKANKARVKSMEEAAKTTSSLQDYVENLLKDWFDTIFIHRYRDIDAAIRRECVTALGDWIVSVPSVFFDGSHLRYMGWLLSDSVASTRSEVIKQLIRLYKMPDMIGGLKTFTERFRPRMVEIATSDSESNVRAAGVELLDLLREHGLLEPNDIDAVGRLVFDSDVKVRKTVSHFLAESINEMYESKIDNIGGLETLEENLPEVNEDNYDAPRLQWLKLKCLAEMLFSYDSEEALPSQIGRSGGDGGLTLLAAGADSRFTLAADVLFDSIEEVRDWRMLAGYVLFDHSAGASNGVADDSLSQLKHEASLTESEQIVLLEVLNTSVKRTLTDAAERIQSTKAKLTKKQKADLQEEQEESAADLAAAIPKLLRTYGDSSETAAAVLRLESILGLPSLHDLRQESATAGALLEDIKKQFMSHSSDNVLVPASNAILHAQSYGELDELTEETIAGLWDDVVRNFAELIDPATLAKRGAASHEELVALSNNLLRVIRLAQVTDCISPLENESSISLGNVDEDLKGPIDCVLALVQRAVPDATAISDAEDAAEEDKVSARAAEAAIFYFRWKFKALTEQLTTASSPDVAFEELEALASRRDRFDTFLNNVLDARKPREDICLAIAGFQLDLYSSAATLQTVKPKPGSSDDYTVLIMDIEGKVESNVMKVFSATEKNFAKLTNKRLEDPPVQDKADAEIEADEIEDDPMSDPESDDEDENTHTQTQTQTQTQASQQRRQNKLIKSLLAERSLCELTSKLIYAVLGGVIKGDRVRKRIERNRSHLGPNFKAVCMYLDPQGTTKKGAKAKNAAKAKGKTAAESKKVAEKKNAKSNAIVAEDEEDDEIEDPEEEDVEALRRRGLVVDEDDAEVMDGAEADAVAGEEESVLGD